MSRFLVRPYRQSDEDFVYSGWMRSFRDSHYAGIIPYSLYHPMMRETLGQLLGLPGCKTLIATTSLDDDQLAGFLAMVPGETPVVLYSYTKDAFRRHGVQRLLWTEAGINVHRPWLYVCRTRGASEVLRHVGGIGKHSPLTYRDDSKRSPRHG